MVQNPENGSDYPLLEFPEPIASRRSRRGGFGGGGLRRPESREQAERLAPQFRRLQEAMENKRLNLQTSTHGLEPEQVLVLETAGSIDDFFRAVARIRGLEWLGEIQDYEVAPEYGFENPRDAQRDIPGQIFLVMTDQRAQNELLNYFGRWQNNPDERFGRGYAKLKDVFEHLRDIRPWDAQDRIRDTGILDDWQERLNYGEEFIPFETELWFRRSPSQRQDAASEIQGIITSVGGSVVQQCVIPDIEYHGILANVPRTQIEAIVEFPEVQHSVSFLQWDGIRFLRPVGQCFVLLPEDPGDTPQIDEEQPEPPAVSIGEPVVALLDGVPLTGHQLLDDRIIIDDPDDYQSAYLARERFHGTAMSSLICHGDLSNGTDSVRRVIYARPILKPRRRWDGFFEEYIPQDVLPVDLIHRAVRRMYENEGGNPPSAPNVRVINLSVCDTSRPFDKEISPLARLLDWLSWKYQVLFVVSAGNHRQNIELNVARDEFAQLSPEKREKLVIEALAEDTRNRRLLSPAESINSLTVAATHEDGSTDPQGMILIDPFVNDGLPSVVNAQGPGPRRMIKPDVLLPGGRQFLTEMLGDAHPKSIMEVPTFQTPPGQMVATPGTLGGLGETCYTRGTSNATALASRGALLIQDALSYLRNSLQIAIPGGYEAVLLKALLVHGSDWSNAWQLYEQTLKNVQNGRKFREYVGRFFGYGPANIPRVLACTEQRATVIGVGAIEEGVGHEYRLPLPPCLASKAENRRLTITLAWLTPISNTHRRYRTVQLWFNPTQQNILARRRINADHNAAQRGTVQHEVLEGDEAVPYQNGEEIAIKVNCRADAGELTEEVPYALALTLEVAEETDLPIYQEIRNSLAVPIPVPAGG